MNRMFRKLVFVGIVMLSMASALSPEDRMKEEKDLDKLMAASSGDTVDN